MYAHRELYKIRDWMESVSENLTLILRFLQLEHPLRLLGWLLRETIVNKRRKHLLPLNKHSVEKDYVEI